MLLVMTADWPHLFASARKRFSGLGLDLSVGLEVMTYQESGLRRSEARCMPPAGPGTGEWRGAVGS